MMFLRIGFGILSLTTRRFLSDFGVVDTGADGDNVDFLAPITDSCIDGLEVMVPLTAVCEASPFVVAGFVFLS